MRIIEVEVRSHPYLLNLGFGHFEPTNLISLLWFVYLCFGSIESVIKKTIHHRFRSLLVDLKCLPLWNLGLT